MKQTFYKRIICGLLVGFGMISLLLVGCSKLSPSLLTVEKMPDKTQYAVGNTEILDLSGGILGVVYEDGSTKTVAMTEKGVSHKGFDTGLLGKRTITLSYLGLSIEIEIEVIAAPIQIDSVAVVTKPAKTRYLVGEELDITGGRLAAYTGGSVSYVNLSASDVEVSELDSSTLGTKTITVTYKGKGADFTVDVIEPWLYEILELIDVALDMGDDLVFVACNRAITQKIAELDQAQAERVYSWEFGDQSAGELLPAFDERCEDIGSIIPEQSASPQLFNAYQSLIDIYVKKISQPQFAAGSNQFDLAVSALIEQFLGLSLDMQLDFFCPEFSNLINEYGQFHLTGEELSVFTALSSSITAYYQSLLVVDMTVFLNRMSACHQAYVELDDSTQFDAVVGNLFDYYVAKLENLASSSFDATLGDIIVPLNAAYLATIHATPQVFAHLYLTLSQTLFPSAPSQLSLKSTNKAGMSASNADAQRIFAANTYEAHWLSMRSNKMNISTMSALEIQVPTANTNNLRLFAVDINAAANASEMNSVGERVPAGLSDFEQYLYTYWVYDILDGETVVISATASQIFAQLTQFYMQNCYHEILETSNVMQIYTNYLASNYKLVTEGESDIEALERALHGLSELELNVQHLMIAQLFDADFPAVEQEFYSQKLSADAYQTAEALLQARQKYFLCQELPNSINQQAFEQAISLLDQSYQALTPDMQQEFDSLLGKTFLALMQQITD